MNMSEYHPSLCISIALPLLHLILQNLLYMLQLLLVLIFENKIAASDNSILIQYLFMILSCGVLHSSMAEVQPGLHKIVLNMGICCYYW